MKINRLDAHDRLKHFTNIQGSQSVDIGECCQDLINKKPFGDFPFYIFCHSRTDDDGLTKRLIWQPRLTKPKAASNSMLFKAYPGKDIVKVIWMIPAPEMWAQYTKGKLAENKTVCESIEAYKNDRQNLEAKEDDDLSDSQIDAVYREICMSANYRMI